MTLATLLRAPRGVVDPIGVARRELALIEALRARPGAALGEIAKAAEHTRSATADRLRRLAARGAVVKVAGRWRLAGEERTNRMRLRCRNLSPRTRPDGFARSDDTCES
jgi:DNA-binding MarR family transcriptional regulator